VAVVYCYDGGSNTSPYDTWAKAATAFGTAVTFASAGDDIWLASDHSETVGSSTYTFPGTQSAITRIISVDRTDDTYLKASTFQVSGGASGDFTFGGVYQMEGCYFRPGDDLIMVGTDNVNQFIDCTLELGGTGSSVTYGTSAGGNVVRLKNTDVNFSNSGDGFVPGDRLSDLEWFGGTLSFTGTQPTNLFSGGGRSGRVRVRGVDLSVFTGTLAAMGTVAQQYVEIINCILNSGVTPASTIVHQASYLLMIGCDDTTGNDLYRSHYEDYFGSTVHDDAIYRTSGASDGTNNISWKMVSNANAVEYSEPTKSLPISGWINTTGSTTFTVHTNMDNATDLQDDEIWLEIEYLGVAANTKLSNADDRMTDIQSTPANQATSTEGWTGTGGFTNENKHQLVVTQTVNRVGPYIARVLLAKPSTTVYIDPLVELS